MLARESPGKFEAGSALSGSGLLERRGEYRGHSWYVGIRDEEAPIRWAIALFQWFRFKLFWIRAWLSLHFNRHTPDHQGGVFTNIYISYGVTGMDRADYGSSDKPRYRYCSNGRGCSTNPSSGARYVLFSKGKLSRSFICSASWNSAQSWG